MNRKIGALLVVSLCCWAGQSAEAAGVSALYVSEIHNRALVLVLVGESPNISENSGHGTGTLLYDYTGEGYWLLTARHVIDGENMNYVFPVLSTDDDELKLITRRPVALKDSLGEPRFLHMSLDNGTDCDLALLHISHLRDSIINYDQPYRPLVKSQLAFEDNVYSGDRLLIFGFSDIEGFHGLTLRQPLVTGAVVAAETPYQYMIDQDVFNGMSGGLAFKEYIGLMDSTCVEMYAYKPIGIVSAHVLATDSIYSWITKIDFIDSPLVKETGSRWGE